MCRNRNIWKTFKKDVSLRGISCGCFIKSCWENVNVDHTSSWTISWSYLIYRGVFLTYFLICIISSVYRSNIRHLWFIWATNLSLLGQTIYGTIFFLNLLFRFIKNTRRRGQAQAQAIELNYDQERTFDETNQDSSLNIFDSITWCLLNIVGTIPFIITLGYWLFVYNPNLIRESLGWDLLTHGVNAILALVDILIISIPIHLAHAVYTVSFGLLYLLFSAIYEYTGGVYRDEDKPYIYAFLNWRQEPETTLISCLLAIVAAFFLHFCLWLLFKLRVRLVSTFKKSH